MFYPFQLLDCKVICSKSTLNNGNRKFLVSASTKVFVLKLLYFDVKVSWEAAFHCM